MPVLHLDGGDMLFKTPWPIETEKKQLELKARYIGEICGNIGLVAAALGECDLAAGADFAAKIAKDAGFYFLASNLYGKDGKKPFASHMLVEVQGIKVGIFGITNTITGSTPGQQGLVQKEALAAASEEVAFLRPQCRFLICLSHQGLIADQELAKRVPGIDVIVGGHSREMTTEPVITGNTLIVQGFVQGKYLGRLDLDVPATAPTTAAWYHHRQGAPEPPAGMLKFRAMFQPLDKALGDDPAVAAKLKEYQAEVAKLNKAAPQPPAPQPAVAPPKPVFTYWGAPLCSSCHVEQAQFWADTAHAKAIDILKRKNRQLDQECIGCHTTGFRQPGGFELPAKMFGFENVQCEACHGPGIEHGKGGMGKLSLKAETCLKCHDKENSPEFDHESMLPVVSCPKMARPTDTAK